VVDWPYVVSVTSDDEPSSRRPRAERSRTGSVPLRVMATAALILAIGLGLRANGLLPSVVDPFANRETDRSQPVLLQSIRDLSYLATDGTFQVVVDLQEHQENIPDFLVNRRTLFVGSGSVQASIDFGALTEDAVVADKDAGTVKITLPAPQLSKASLDLERSYVVSEERGWLTRISDAFRTDPDKQERVYEEAQTKITDAARASGLDQRARENTQKMLVSLLGSLGYPKVTVIYLNP